MGATETSHFLRRTTSRPRPSHEDEGCPDAVLPPGARRARPDRHRGGGAQQ